MRVCRRCLLYEGIQLFLHRHSLPDELTAKLTIDDSGLCSVCRAYDERFDRALIEEELEQFYFETRGMDAPVLVALSGGKDSLSTLYVVAQQKIKAVAALFQNGFIPQEVVKRCQEATDRLGVPLQIIRLQGAEQESFSHVVESTSIPERSPCDLCATTMVQKMAEEAHKLGISWLVSGTNYFNPWQPRPQATLEYRVNRRTLTILNLPYALELKQDDVLKNIDALGVSPVAGFTGVTSNCRVPALVQSKVAAPLGHVPELEDLSFEILVGHRTRASALDELQRKAPQFAALLERYRDA